MSIPYPISTAPRDGSKFLAIDGEDIYGCSLLYEEDDGRPIWSTHCGQPCVQEPEPTHWLPWPLTQAQVTGGEDEKVEDSCGCVFKDLNVPCKDHDCKICATEQAEKK